MGLRSGDWLCHFRTLMCFFLSHSFVAMAVCFGSLSCWNIHPRLIFNALALTVHGPIHHPFDAVQLSCPLCRKTTQSIMFRPPCLTVGMVFLGWQHSSSSKHGELSWCQRAGFWPWGGCRRAYATCVRWVISKMALRWRGETAEETNCWKKVGIFIFFAYKKYYRH